MNIHIINRKDEVVGALEVEDATATKGELERHYTHFVNLFMRHLGRNLRAVVQS